MAAVATMDAARFHCGRYELANSFLIRLDTDGSPFLRSMICGDRELRVFSESKAAEPGAGRKTFPSDFLKGNRVLQHL